jgi:phage terminase small subunit
MAKSDTIKGMVESAIEAQKEIPKPPEHLGLDDTDLNFYYPIVCGRAPSEWTPFRINLAAQLAQAQAELFRQRQLMKGEGAVVENQRGTPVANPRVQVMAQQAQQILALTRALSLQVQTDPRDQGRKDKSFRSAKEAQDQVQNEDLLA